MILSNEPGYYRPGALRHPDREPVLVTRGKPIEGGDRPMLGFETLTWPDRPAPDRTDLLTADETAWLDAYHARVLKEVGAMWTARR